MSNIKIYCEFCKGLHDPSGHKIPTEKEACENCWRKHKNAKNNN